MNHDCANIITRILLMQTTCCTFRIRPYDQFITELKALTEFSSRVLVPKKYSYTGGSSFAVYQAVSKNNKPS